MTTRKFFLRRLRQPAPPERIETEPGLPTQDAALARALLTLAQTVQPDQEFVARLEGDLSHRRPTARPAVQDKPSFVERIRHAMQTTWGWALPAGAVIVLILVISLLVQMRPRQTIPSGPMPATASPTVNVTDTPTPPTAVTSAETTYIVQEGDTLLGIAAYFGVTPDAIFEANHMNSGDVLMVGKKLIIPGPVRATPTRTTQYIVQGDDTLLGIAAYFGVTVNVLMEANHMKSGDVLVAGMSLIIPNSSTPVTGEKIIFPKIDRRPRAVTVEDWAAWGYGQALSALPIDDPAVPNIWKLDLRGRDLSKLNLRNALDAFLNAATFDYHTIWPNPDQLPPGFDPDMVMGFGKNPGLGIRALHEQGFTGQGIGIAIISPDPLLVEHQE
jgi:LysM repeat protein